MQPLDVIVPVYDEDLAVVRRTIEALRVAFADRSQVSIFVVDDGSAPRYSLSELEHEPGIRLLRHASNRGYGQALKTAILSGAAPWIAIVDADGSYPVGELPHLVRLMEDSDLVVGVREGPINQGPLVRRWPRRLLNLTASYMADVKIRDLNSGMRVFSRALCYYLWPFFPTGFSFTSTLSMGAHMGGFRVSERPINYFRRSGQSSIRPLRDTYRFFRQVTRLGLIFYPMKVFGPVAALLCTVGAIKGFAIDFVRLGYIGNFALLSMLAGLQVAMMGLLGKLIVHSRLLGAIHPDVRNQAQDEERRASSFGSFKPPG